MEDDLWNLKQFKLVLNKRRAEILFRFWTLLNMHFKLINLII